MSGVGVLSDRGRLGWWLLALALVGALWLALASVAGAVCLGVAAYYAARPIHRSLRPAVRFEGLAALGSLSVLALPMSAALAALVGITAREVALARWLARRYEGTQAFGRRLITTLDAPAQLFSTRELDAIGNAAETGITFSGVVGTVAIHLFVACAIAFYLLRDDHRFVRWVRHRFGFGVDLGRTRRSFPSPHPNHSTDPDRPADSTHPHGPALLTASVPGRRETTGTSAPITDGAGVGTDTRTGKPRILVEYCRRIDRDLERVFFGAAAGAIVTAAVGVLAYGLLGSLAPPALAAPYLQLGLAVGVGGLVPAIGRKLVYLSAAVVLTSVALASGSNALWFVAVFLVASLLVVEHASDRVLRTYGVDPRHYGGLMALACVLGVLQVGWYGVLVGPIVLVSLIQFGRVVVPALLGGARHTPTDGAPTHSTPPVPMPSRAGSAGVTTANGSDHRERARPRPRDRTPNRTPGVSERVPSMGKGGRSGTTTEDKNRKKTAGNDPRPTTAGTTTENDRSRPDRRNT